MQEETQADRPATQQRDTSPDNVLSEKVQVDVPSSEQTSLAPSENVEDNVPTSGQTAPENLPSEKIQVEVSSAVEVDASVSQEIFPPCPYNLDRLMALAGHGPVLKWENPLLYREMLANYLKDLEPENFLQQMSIKHLVDVDWELAQVKRHKALVIERREKQFRELKSAHAKKVDKGNPEKPETKEDKVFMLSWDVHVIRDSVLEIADNYTELDVSRAMKLDIDYYERLERLEQYCFTKRERILAEIRMHSELLYIKAQRYRTEVNTPKLVEEK